MSNLVIVESPAKCGKIQGFLGSGWKVIASLGHIRRLKEDLDAVGIDRDFEASWETIKEKAKTVAQLKEAAKNATTIYLASDDDREGELIAYSVCLLLKLDPTTTPRAVFHEITETAVKAAVAAPRRLDMNKVNAAQARAILDMMVGFTISPLLWKSVGPALSAGRCQTPALRLVADREVQIKDFKSSSSWKISGEWQTAATNTSPSWDAFLTDELEDEENARTYLEIHHNEPNGKVLTAETKPWSESPPLPLITSTLQQMASTLYRCNPKRTMQIAQHLYEAGHITYMRTDKAVLSEEAAAEARKTVGEKYGPHYIGVTEAAAPKPKKTAKSKAIATTNTANPKEEVKAQEAHEAIRPTKMSMIDLPTTEDWMQQDRNIYRLIWLRTIQSVMAQAKGEQRTIHFVADGDDADDFQWRSSWRRTIFEGWRRASTKETTVEGEEAVSDTSSDLWKMASTIQPGQTLKWKSLVASPYDTKAPPRYTEAALIRELEQRGIGRPSTFASLISTILDKKYVDTKSFEIREVDVTRLSLAAPNQWPPTETTFKQKVGGEKDRLVPTPLGQDVLKYLLEHFEDLFNYGFTAQMESRLDTIAEGIEPWKQVLRDTWAAYKERYATLKSAKATVTGKAAERRREFAGGISAVMTKKGPLLLKESEDGDKDKTVFYGWPSGADFHEIPEQQVVAFCGAAEKEKQGTILGYYEGTPIVKKTGKFGPYIQCNGKNMSCQESDTLETIIEKLSQTTSATLRIVGEFEIRQGQYGPYAFKRNVTGPSRKFVGIPKEMNIEEVTAPQLIALIQSQIAQKARATAYASKTSYAKKEDNNGDAPSGGGSRGGRGGWRGGRGGGSNRGGSRGKK
jgi:DNA topoisomerase-1